MTMHRWLLALCALFASTYAFAAGARSTVEPLVIGETFRIDSKVLAETRRINVYLPPGYAGSTARMPVMVMPDGGLAEDFLHIAGLIEVSVGNGTMRPFILVGIENTERRRDMTGPTDNPEDRKIAPRVGGSAAFRKFIRDELMPEVKRRYRTTDETAIVGQRDQGCVGQHLNGVARIQANDARSYQQVVNLESVHIGSRNALARKIDRLPLFHGRIVILSIRDEGS